MHKPHVFFFSFYNEQLPILILLPSRGTQGDINHTEQFISWVTRVVLLLMITILLRFVTLGNVTLRVTVPSITIVRSVFPCRGAKFRDQLCLKRFVCGIVTVIEFDVTRYIFVS